MIVLTSISLCLFVIVCFVLQELRVKTDRLEEVFTSLDERLRGIEVELMKGR
jgi:hypothetical protein